MKKEYDVTVCGGGFGGIATALAAARHGSRVALYEKQFMLVGLGTAGIVNVYLPLCVGRCTSVNETMWDVMRVIPCCAATGQVAGTVAAKTDDFTALEVKELQEKLVIDGVVFHEKDIL